MSIDQLSEAAPIDAASDAGTTGAEHDAVTAVADGLLRAPHEAGVNHRRMTIQRMVPPSPATVQ
jgi:hypothetical protein